MLLWHAGPGLPGLRGTNTGELTNTGQLIFHPSTGLCVIRRSVFAPLTLGPCTHPKALWSYTPKKTISLYEADFCIQADGPGKPGKLRNICIDPDTKWEAISDSKLHLSSTVGDGKTVCLDVDFHTHNVVTNWCKCVSDDKTCDPSSQWFKLIKIWTVVQLADWLILPLHTIIQFTLGFIADLVDFFLPKLCRWFFFFTSRHYTFK